jgi:hypothetical protein
MLGHRGVRLGLSFPEIYEMQIRAILEAAAECTKEGIVVHPEIMVPQVCAAEELKRVKTMVDALQAEIEARHGVQLHCRFGTMVEVVAGLNSAALAEARSSSRSAPTTSRRRRSRSRARTPRTSSCRGTSTPASCPTTRSRCSTSTAWDA